MEFRIPIYGSSLPAGPKMAGASGTMNMRKTLLMACLAATPAAAQDVSPREIADAALPAVVLVTALVDGEEIGQGSGFVVSEDGRVVTNRHVIEGADALRVQLRTGEIYDRVYFISADERHDLAILRVPAAGLKTLRLGDDRTAEIGDRVYVVGNPMGLEGTFSDGLVSARRMIDGVAYIQISAPISPGSSGGPVLNDAGEVIGVATLSMPDGQNLNMAVPARYAKGLLGMNEEPRPFEEVASRFADVEPSETDVSADADDDLPKWAEVLASEMRIVREAAEKLGLVTVHDPVIDMIDDDESYSMDFTFDEAGETIILVGVCDIDCTDLDLGIYDGYGEEIDIDVEVDDRPTVEFEVIAGGTFEARAYMATCTREPCGFAVQAFRRPEGN